MGKSLDWVREEPKTGRLLFRRAYPVSLRPYLPEPRSGQNELKVPLKTRRVMTAEAFRLYEGAKRQFADDVRRAGNAAELERKDAAGAVDTLSPAVIAYLVGAWKTENLELDAEVRWVTRPLDVKRRAHRRMREEVQQELDEALNLRGLGDVAAIVETWGAAAAAFAEGEGYRVDRQAPEFATYVRAFHDAQIVAWEAILRRLTGEDVPTPPVPTRPDPPSQAAPKRRTVADLLDAYRAAKWDRWSKSSRGALDPVMRLLRDVLGDRDVRTIDRESAREVLDIVRALPVRLGRRKELEGLTVPEAVEEGKRLGLETIGPGTINRGYMVHVSAIFGWAAAEEWVDKNPFRGLGVADPVDARDKRDPFTIPQLQTLFAASPWTAPASHDIEKPGRYWVPLLALFTGMRLGEAAGLRVMDVETLEGVPAFRVRPHDGRTLKNKESRRDVPVHSELVRLGLLDFVAHRRSSAASEALLFPDGKANIRGQSGAKLGEWFVSLLKERGIAGVKLGMHSFRHSFEDRLRPAGLHGRPEGQALAGRKVSGSEGGYGSGFTIADLKAALERVGYPDLDLSHLAPGNGAAAGCLAAGP